MKAAQKSVSARLMNRLRSIRLNSTTALKKDIITYPIEPASKVLRHLQFVQKLPFESGSSIQEKFVRAHLDIKALQSKIKKQIASLEKEHDAEIQLHSDEQKIVDTINQMKPNPIVLTFQFEPTYTGGKRIKRQITDEEISLYENFVPPGQKDGIKPKFVQVERGGQVTFHGPGQMVAYVILDLKTFKNFPAKCLVSAIENAAIKTLETVPKNGDVLQPLNLAVKKTKETGVWTSDDKKIASIGINVRRSITSHGVSINVDPDLSYMNSFTMCGLANSKATSIREQIPDSTTTVDDVAKSFVKELAKQLGIDTVERAQLDELPVDA